MKPSPPYLWLLALGLMSVSATPFATADDSEPTIQTERPTDWAPSRGRQCRSKGRYKKFCDGPRRIPRAHGEAALLADELGLGLRKTAGKLHRSAPRPKWVQAVKGTARRTLLWPVEGGRFGRGFGFTRKRRKKLRHKGIDVGAERGMLVRAANDALVAYSDNGVRGYGNMVILIHANGTVTSYAHHRANYVFAGQQVARGQVIGEVGMTGIARGPHLHFEYRKRGRARDPMPIMVGRGKRRQRAFTDLFWF